MIAKGEHQFVLFVRVGAAADVLELGLDLPARVSHGGPRGAAASGKDDATITVIDPCRKEERAGEGAQQ